MTPPPPTSTLFPYTTLFRSARLRQPVSLGSLHRRALHTVDEATRPGARGFINRSEEHTSELQSHHDLVCRLLLEKKKKTHTASSWKRAAIQSPSHRNRWLTQ